MTCGPLQKYQNLGLRQSLSLSYRYSLACRELGSILRIAYSKSPKPLQSLLFEDTLIAFRLLPQMQTQSAVSAANFLNQSAEAALPKQKRGVAATEFKQSKVAYKRRAKTQQQNIGLTQLPHDVLVHLFSFLDLQTLVSTSLVCWSWNAAANDKYLWQFYYNTHFGEFKSTLERDGLQGGNIAKDRQLPASDGVDYDWKDAFRRAYIDLSCQRYKYHRGYCSLCNSIVWLNNLKCPNHHARQRCGNKLLKPVSPAQVDFSLFQVLLQPVIVV
ncbi:hypothetical protein RDABS01_013604 [Bienertia sinuspersici]